MQRLSITIGLVLLSAFGSACRDHARSADAIPADVPGSYVYAANGSLLKKVPWQFAATLDLKPDGTYTLALDKTMNGEKDSTERTGGTYTVSGDKVFIKGVEKGHKREPEHALLIRSDSLVGEIGWKVHLVLRSLGAPDPVFVKRTASYTSK